MLAEFYGEAFPPQVATDDLKYALRGLRDTQDVQAPVVRPDDIPPSWDTPPKETSGAVTAS